LHSTNVLADKACGLLPAFRERIGSMAGSTRGGRFGRDYGSYIFVAKETTLPRGRLALVFVHVNSGNRDRSGRTARPRLQIHLPSLDWYLSWRNLLEVGT